MCIEGSLCQAEADKGDSRRAGASETFAFAVSNAFWILVALLAAGAVLTWLFVRDPESPGEDPALPPEPSADELHHYWHHRRFHI